MPVTRKCFASGTPAVKLTNCVCVERDEEGKVGSRCVRPKRGGASFGLGWETHGGVLLADLLARHLANRQLRVGADVVRFLAPRIERSFAAAAAAAARLDKAALAEKKPITRPFARRILGV